MNGNQVSNVEAQLRTMRTVWLAALFSIGGYYVVCLLNQRREDLEPNNTLFLVFVGVSLAATLVSFFIKSQLLNRAIEQQQVPQARQAYVAAWAITEVGAILGIIDYFATRDRYYYLLFVIAFCGQLLHFPRRADVLNASFKRSI